MSVIPILGKERQEDPGASQSASITESVTFRFNRHAVSKRMVASYLVKHSTLTSGLHMSMHTDICVHT